MFVVKMGNSALQTHEQVSHHHVMANSCLRVFTLWKSANCQPFRNFPDPRPQPFPNQNYMVPMTFQKQNFQLFHFFSCVQINLLVIFPTDAFFVDSQPLCTNLIKSQPSRSWDWPKSNSQLFHKFPTGMGTPLSTCNIKFPIQHTSLMCNNYIYLEMYAIYS